jgi:hypothetical protein
VTDVCSPPPPREHYFENRFPQKTTALTRVAYVGYELRSFFRHVLDIESISAIASLIGFQKNQR